MLQQPFARQITNCCRASSLDNLRLFMGHHRSLGCEQIVAGQSLPFLNASPAVPALTGILRLPGSQRPVPSAGPRPKVLHPGQLRAASNRRITQPLPDSWK
jgi:hypothetical protein